MNTFENPELVPSREKVMEIIASHMEGLKFDITREFADEQGVYFLEIMTELDSSGRNREYTFYRKNPRTGLVTPPAVDVAYFRGDSLEVGEEIHKF